MKGQRSVCLEEQPENKKEMHGQTGLKWHQSALMKTDGRMSRYEWRRWRRGCIHLLESCRDKWKKEGKDSESGLDSDDEHRPWYTYKIEG